MFAMFFCLQDQHPVFVVNANTLNCFTGNELLFEYNLLYFVAITALGEEKNEVFVDGVVMITVEFILTLVEGHAVKIMFQIIRLVLK